MSYNFLTAPLNIICNVEFSTFSPKSSMSFAVKLLAALNPNPS